MNFVSLTIDSIVGFFALFILTKILGKSQITQITAFDFIAALVLGELVGNALFDNKAGVFAILYAVLLWGFLIYGTEYITQKITKSRELLEGKPSIVIRNGKLQKDAMKEAKLDLNQLQHLLRSKDTFSIRDVEFAVFETDGTISVLKKSLLQQATRSDVNAKPERVVLPYSVILDGEVVADNLKEVQLTEQQLKEELSKQEIQDYKEVFYAEWKEGEGLYVEPY
ncbi:Uncharacterized membrane protein YcaP, DUF421 family [Salinibacillus kushneri]|uniref:Uncharacterized membrane protein YcaP, DUF421 family n=1 Tax=Salinibacillus kushneri TaxID=237682 RepID=A0A1I0J0S3_9BACI|nr:DUF421 domain-containing protein [Salinibacillus kushneri]SEU02623.1 Uncharacterized membrane protein YcaP, DUF421 family [Salinibacillus kushneri]